LGIEELAGVAEVHLRLLAGRDLHPDARAGRCRGLAPQEAFHRGIAAAEVVLLDQQLPDRLALDAARMQLQHLLTERLDEGLLMGRPILRRGLHERHQHARLRQRACEQAVTLGPEPVVRDRVTADAEIPRDTPVWLAQLHPPHDLPDIGHRAPPSRHSPPLRAVVAARRRSATTVGTSKEPGASSAGGSAWPPLGGSIWAT